MRASTTTCRYSLTTPTSSPRHGDGPRVADGMSESIEINGAGVLTKYEPNTIQRLLQQIILVARNAGKIPK